MHNKPQNNNTLYTNYTSILHMEMISEIGGVWDILLFTLTALFSAFSLYVSLQSQCFDRDWESECTTYTEILKGVFLVHIIENN